MNDYIIKDSGAFRSFDTGAKRDDDTNKIRYELIHWILWDRLAIHLGKGAKKYGDHNWQKGIPTEVYKASLLRHTMSAIKDMEDEDHLAAIAFNVMGIMYNQMKEEK